MKKQWMFTVYESGVSAIQAIMAHGFRSLLTTLGIIIGVASVITVVAIMESLSHGVTSQLKDLTPDVVTIRAYTPTEQAMLGKRNRLTYNDFLAIRNRTKDVENLTVQMDAFSLGSGVRYQQSEMTTRIIGTESSYQNVINMYPEMGRFLTDADDQRRRRVVFIGPRLIEKLKLPENPVGEYLQIQEEWFRIIGVAEAKGSFLGFDQDNYIITPYSTTRALMGAGRTDNLNILFRPKPNISLDEVQEQISEILLSRRPQGSDQTYFEFETAEKTREQLDGITDSITLVATAVVGISLLVGGIGIMNIMLVSVTERTREIGIAKALGATSAVILLQFLMEALALALSGGVAGVLIGYLFAALITLALPGDTGVMLPIWAIWLALGFSGMIGVIFGMLPAMKAAKLDPIEALRYE